MSLCPRKIENILLIHSQIFDTYRFEVQPTNDKCTFASFWYVFVVVLVVWVEVVVLVVEVVEHRAEVRTMSSSVRYCLSFFSRHSLCFSKHESYALRRTCVECV